LRYCDDTYSGVVPSVKESVDMDLSPHSPYKKSKSLISGGFPEIGVYSLFRR
jgi:hypothetical protein